MRQVVTNRGKRGLAAAEQMFGAKRIAEPTEAAMFELLNAPAVAATAATEAAIEATAEAGQATSSAYRAALDVQGVVTAYGDLLGEREETRTGRVVLDGDETFNVEMKAVESDDYAFDLSALFDGDRLVRWLRDGRLVGGGMILGDPNGAHAVIDLIEHPYAAVVLESFDGTTLAELRQDGTTTGVFGGSGGGQPIDASYTQPTWVEDFA